MRKKILFFTETKLTTIEMEPIQRELNFHSMSVVPSRRRSGGLALLWKNDVLLNTQTVSPNHIDAYVSYPVQVQWRLTGIYGHPKDHRNCETCHLMRHLNGYTSLPWLCIGDLMRYCPPMKRMVEYLSRWVWCKPLEAHFSITG